MTEYSVIILNLMPFFSPPQAATEKHGGLYHKQTQSVYGIIISKNGESFQGFVRLIIGKPRVLLITIWAKTIQKE